MGRQSNKLEELELLESVIDAIRDPAVVFDDAGEIVGVNAALRELVGVESALQIAASFYAPERFSSAAEDSAREAREAVVALDLRDATGNPRAFEWAIRPMPRFGGALAIGTESVHEPGSSGGSGAHALTLERELELHKAALDEHAIVAVTDPAGRITYANRRFQQISGYSEAELLGADHRLVNSGFHPRSFFKKLWRTIQNGRTFRGEIRNRAKDGSFYWVDTTIVPFRDDAGKITQYVAIRADITEKKRMNERIVQSSKFAALGELAANIAHEVNNPIGIISGKARLLHARYVDNVPEKVIDEMAKIVQQCERLEGLTRRMLEYSRPNPSARERLDVHTPLRRALDFVSHRATTSRIEIVRELVDGRADILGNGNELEQVFLNLFLNAMDAMPDGGTLRVVTKLHRESIPSRVVVLVEDTGRGIDEAVIGRIFDPFFTTKTQGGTGLGLAISYGIIGSHGGTIEVESEPGAGTRFMIALPPWTVATSHASEEA